MAQLKNTAQATNNNIPKDYKMNTGNTKTAAEFTHRTKFN